MNTFWVLTLLLVMTTGFSQPASQPTSPTAERVPVVVELFTSEGCSSCPAADATLRELETAQPVPGVEVIALGEHVDYWNRLGWKDPFSSAQFSARQRAYTAHFTEGNYTPQAIVNGRYELVGSRRQELSQRLTEAARAPHAIVLLTVAAGRVAVQVRSLPTGTKAAHVILAITETDLSTQVGRGENAGQLLRHAAVVRTLRTLGLVSTSSTFAATVPLSIDPIWKINHLQAVVLVQDISSQHVIGVASLPLGASAAN